MNRNKKITIYLGSIIPVVAIIVSIIIWRCPVQPPDFSISIDPMEGVVQQDGVIQTTITVKSIGKYEYNVSLSASGQPSNVVAVFVPPIGGPKPTFTSNVMINVRPDVPIGDYEITIKGTGADGKEHGCKYKLSVILSQIIESTTQSTPDKDKETDKDYKEIEIPEVKIISPKDGDEVPLSTIVRGSFSGKLPEGQYMWIVINPHLNPGQWWPQESINPQEEWNGTAWLGGKEETGIKFEIAVILINEKDNQSYVDYLKTGKDTGSYPGISLPDSANIKDQITVIRE